jgi:hypothetical protein
MRKVILAYLGVLILLLIMASFIRSTYFPTDEQFYINYAKCFVGIKDSCVFFGVPYGYSLFLIPFVFIEDVLFQYSAILFFNAFVLSGIFGSLIITLEF